MKSSSRNRQVRSGKVVPKSRSEAKGHRKAGRPSLYSAPLADRICASLAEGKSLRSICKQDGMPHLDTVFGWLRTHEEFSEQYARAREAGADALVEEILDIADDIGEDVQRSRLKVDARKWIASKLKPKKYGERLKHELTGQDGGPIESVWILEPVAPVRSRSE